MKKWETISKSKVIPSTSSGQNPKVEEVIHILLENRGLKTKKEIDEFLHPSLDSVTISSVGIDSKQVQKAIKRISEAIEKKETIVVYGDYDVDGITGTAILWETLHGLGANVHPYIPHRVEEGYGLSLAGISNLKSQISNVSLIITVDNGVVANEAVEFAKSQGIDVIITDHHTVGETLPKAHAIVHTTKLCGAAVGWMLSQSIVQRAESKEQNGNTLSTQHSAIRFLDLVALATVADLVPLTGANRALLKASLPYLQHTKRVGLQALYQEASVDPSTIGVYEIGHIIAPRLNAMGRLESAMDSLRLLCTKDPVRAKRLAAQLGTTNRERQLLTKARSAHAIERVKGQGRGVKNVLFIADEGYEEGIIGLIAGKLVEEFYRPAIVIAKGEKVSKASARSVAGFNIIAFIRSHAHLLINAGGHPMAAGFTVETEKILLLQEALESLSEEEVTEEHLTRILRIDCELPFDAIAQELYNSLQQLAPFGMGNPEPIFVSRKVGIEDIRLLGKDKKHVKLRLKSETSSFTIEAIGFGLAEKIQGIKVGDTIDIAYALDENEWNGRKKLQLKVKDIRRE